MKTIKVPFTAVADDSITAKIKSLGNQTDSAVQLIIDAIEENPDVELEILIDGDGAEPRTYETLIYLSSVFDEFRCQAHGKPMSDEARVRYRKSPEKFSEYNRFRQEISCFIDFGYEENQLKLVLEKRKSPIAPQFYINPEIIKRQNSQPDP